jgi:CRP-like cAMP-binding protein
MPNHRNCLDFALCRHTFAPARGRPWPGDRRRHACTNDERASAHREPPAAGQGRCEHPEVYQNLMKVLATRLRLTDETVAAGSFLSLKGRVARTLLELADEFGRNVGSGRVVIHQKIGQSDLAAMTGIARENLSRVFNDWRRRKLVSRLAGYYCLENKARLKAEAEL